MPRYDICLVCGTAWAGCDPIYGPPFYCNDACLEQASLPGFVGEQMASRFPGAYAIGTVTITKHHNEEERHVTHYEFGPLRLFTPEERLQRITGGMDTSPRACP